MRIPLIVPLCILLFSLSCSLSENDSQEILTLVDGFKPAGTHVVLWDQHNDEGSQTGAGSYKAKLRSSGKTYSVSFRISAAPEQIHAAASRSLADQSNGSPNSIVDSIVVTIPMKYSISTNLDTYFLDDTIRVTYQMPKAAKARVWIEK